MSENAAALSVIPMLFALFLCFKAGMRRARNEKWLRLVLASFFFVFLGWFMCFTGACYLGYDTAKRYYEEILRQIPTPPPNRPPAPDPKIQTT